MACAQPGVEGFQCVYNSKKKKNPWSVKVSVEMTRFLRLIIDI